MSVRGWSPGKEVLEPRGMWSYLAQKSKGNPARASFMQNARVSPGIVASRPGTSAVRPDLQSRITGLFNWIAPSGNNYVAYQDGGIINAFRQQPFASQILLSPTVNMYRPSFADLDIWLYFTGYDTNGNGAAQCLIYDGANVDKAFRNAIALNSATVIVGGPGFCSAGNHLIGFVYRNRTGFAGVPTTSAYVPPAPVTSSYPALTPPTFTPTQGPGTGAINYSEGIPNGVTITGVTNFAGWVNCTSNRVVGILIYIDGHYVGQALYGGVRFDAAAVHPISPDNPYIGFNFGFDCSVLSGGRHTWFGIVFLDDGRTLQMPTMNFQVTPGFTPGGVFPLAITLDAGGGRINVSASVPALPDAGGSAALFLIMTRADNPNTWYFMPTDTNTGAVGEQPVPFNTPVTLNFVANLSDADMADSLAGDTANEQFLLVTQDANGYGPFLPSFVVTYGQRMCFGNGPSLYISDINDPQHITGDQHVVTMPNKRAIAYAFPLPGSTDLYLTGDRWTARVTDNSDVPATWAQPILTSDSLGAPFPACVCYRTRGDYAWIVTEGGIYVFTGSYSDRPITYLVSDQWARVNWSAAYAIETADDVAGLRFYCAVPLDGAQSPSHLFVIDYTNGLTYDEVDIGLDVYAQPFSSIAIVKELSKVSNLWFGPNYPNGLIARLDPATHNDQGQPIDSFWESGLMRGINDFNSRLIRVGALDLWLRGNGNLITTVYGPDKAQNVAPQLLTASGVPALLSPAPGTMYQEKFDLAHVENYTVRVETNAVDAWWELSEITGYAKGDLYNR